MDFERCGDQNVKRWLQCLSAYGCIAMLQNGTSTRNEKDKSLQTAIQPAMRCNAIQCNSRLLFAAAVKQCQVSRCQQLTTQRRVYFYTLCAVCLTQCLARSAECIETHRNTRDLFTLHGVGLCFCNDWRSRSDQPNRTRTHIAFPVYCSIFARLS